MIPAWQASQTLPPVALPSPTRCSTTDSGWSLPAAAAKADLLHRKNTRAVSQAAGAAAPNPLSAVAITGLGQGVFLSARHARHATPAPFLSEVQIRWVTIWCCTQALMEGTIAPMKVPCNSASHTVGLLSSQSACMQGRQSGQALPAESRDIAAAALWAAGEDLSSARCFSA